MSRLQRPATWPFRYETCACHPWLLQAFTQLAAALEIMTKHQTHSWCKLFFSCTHVWPLGGVAGLLLSIFGYEEILRGQRIPRSNALREVETYMSVIIMNHALDSIPIAIIPMDFIIVAYGLRKRCRMLFTSSGVYRQIFCVKCINFVWKSILQSAAFLSCAIALGCIIIFEAHFLFLFALDIVCNAGSDTIATVLNATHKWTSSFEEEVEEGNTLEEAEEEIWPEYCQFSRNSKDGAFQSFVGSICLTCGQFVIALYLMKYSTLTPALSNNTRSLDASASRIRGNPRLFFQYHELIHPRDQILKYLMHPPVTMTNKIVVSIQKHESKQIQADFRPQIKKYL